LAWEKRLPGEQITGYWLLIAKCRNQVPNVIILLRKILTRSNGPL
jgi:hypothetical protein